MLTTQSHIRRARQLASGSVKVAVVVPVLIQEARENFSAFCEAMNKPNAEHHKLWVDEFVTNKDSSQLLKVAGPNTAILAPRGSAKSTLLGLLCAWLIGVHTQHKKLFRSLYLGYSLDIARSRSHTIKSILRTKRYREIFPEVRLSKARQSDELWSIDFDYAEVPIDGDDPYTLVAQGLSGSIASRRSQLAIVDDCIKSSDSIMNPAIRERMQSNWHEVVKPTLLEGGRAIVLGTRFLSSDIFSTTFSESGNFRVITQQAIVTDAQGIEHSYWPSQYSLGYLKKLRDEDPVAFSFQFQNNPVAASTLDFQPDWLKTKAISGDYESLCIGIDLSSGLKERNDWTVFTMTGVDKGVVEVIDFRRMRSLGNMEKIADLCELLNDWGVILKDENYPDEGDEVRWLPTETIVTINIEEMSYQASLRGDATTFFYEKHGLHNIVFKGIKSWKGDKLQRLRGYLGLFQHSRISFNEFIDWETYWQEFKNLCSADHDDCVDSLVIALKGLIGQSSLQNSWQDWSDD